MKFCRKEIYPYRARSIGKLFFFLIQRRVNFTRQLRTLSSQLIERWNRFDIIMHEFVVASVKLPFTSGGRYRYRKITLYTPRRMSCFVRPWSGKGLNPRNEPILAFPTRFVKGSSSYRQVLRCDLSTKDLGRSEV